MHTTLRFFLFACLFVPGWVNAQSLLVSPTDSLVRVDGLHTEGIWQRAQSATGFVLNFPNDTASAYNDTDVRITYDTDYLYIAVTCYDRDPQKRIIASSLRRDWEWDQNDNFTVYLDPFGDRTNGFTFNITPLGVEREGQMFNGERVAPEWDNKWRSAVKRFPDRWQAEMAIPFKSIRYKKNTGFFLMNFARHDLKNNQRAAWRRVPIAYRISALAFADTVRFTRPLPNPGPNLSIIPYIAGNGARNFLEGNGKPDYGSSIGGDIKVAVTPSLNLDVTVNPDFSQVEVDQQVTNLNRFEIFFPERRQFFLENNDLFANLGFLQSRPFFSRRIGLGRDTTTGQVVQNPISVGARLSGKIDKNWRIGVLSTLTGRQRARGIEREFYNVAIVQRQVFTRSNVVGFLVDRQSSVNSVNGPYTRVAGGEFNLLTADNRWSGKVWAHKAFRPDIEGKFTESAAHGTLLTYTSRNLTAEWAHEYIGRDYRINDVGFVARRGQWGFFPNVSYTAYPENSRKIVSHGPGFEGVIYSGLNGKLLDRELNFFYDVVFKNTAELSAGYYNYFTYLFSPFDPTNSEGVELPQNSSYRARGGFWSFSSDSRKLFQIQAEGWMGEYFNGTNVNVAPSISYRFQPYGSISVVAEHNDIRLPRPYNSASFWLIGPRLELSFTRSLFLTTVVQYNEQARNVNLNARFQWRFKPVSDFFVVYQENYLPTDLRIKNRFLVLKATYWLNV
ncbi:MAG: hypothetical protein EAZ91_04640 [Cytophagales bacterium]|nr:MAG: hypothetical protein EAZ91_04640 [Cytophagales bacterium]